MRTPPSIGFRPGTMNTLRLIAHLPNFVKLYWRLFNDKRVSWLSKAMLVGALLYLVIPFDFVPVLPVIGCVDDAVIVGAALWAFMKLCPRRVVLEHVEIIDQGG